MPPCRRVWAVFVNQPPKWHVGTGAPVLNAAMLAASLLGQSYTGVLALLSFAHALPLAVHLPVQLVSTTAAISLSDELCASALLNNKASLPARLARCELQAASALCKCAVLVPWQRPLQPSLLLFFAASQLQTANAASCLAVRVTM